MKANDTDCQLDPSGLCGRLIHALVQPVPDGLALCEFDCTKTECSVEEWRTCKRRLEALHNLGGRPAEAPAAS
jgi:hypothetical protein